VITAQSDLITAQQNLDDLTTQAETSKNKALQDIMTYESSVRDAQYQLDNFTIPSNQSSLSTTEALTVTKQALDAARTAFEPYKYYPSTDKTREDLKDKLGAAQADYDSAIKRLKYETELEVAKANLEQAWSDFKKWQDGPDPQAVESAKAKVAAAQATLNQTWIEAPFSGTITQVETQVGDRVSSGQVAFRLDNLDTQYIDLDVSEIDIHKIQLGQDAEISLDALPGKTYHGKVTEIAAVSTTSSGAVNFTVTVGMTDADENVRTGMTAEVKISVGQVNDVLLIPVQAMQTKDGKQVVFVLRPGQPEMQPVEVELGLSSDEYSALVKGDLKEGDPIVLNPAAMSGTPQPRMMFGPGGGPGGPRDGGGGNSGGGNSGGGGGQP
jgi:HlyD family secretion protein